MAKSIFDPTNENGNLRGGLDRFLGPEGVSSSHMPPSLTDGKADLEEDEPDTDEELKEIEEAVDEVEKTSPPPGKTE